MDTAQSTMRAQKPRIMARGFTILEMMVALALFTIVMTIAAGSFLSLIGGSSQLQGEQQTMTSLNFAMDSMTREIRTGTHYYCSDNAATEVADLTTPRDCKLGADSLSFVESGSSISNQLAGTTTGQRITYYVDDSSGQNQLMRQIGYGDSGDPAPQKMLSSDVNLKKVKGVQFFVTGAGSLAGTGDVRQPTVTIIIQARDQGDTTKVYTLETTVTQRELDI